MPLRASLSESNSFYSERTPIKRVEKYKHILPCPSFAMACYAYSVLTRWFGNIYSGAGSEPPPDQMAKHIFLPNGIFDSFDVADLNGLKCRHELRLAVRSVRSYPHIECCVLACISCRRTPERTLVQAQQSRNCCILPLLSCNANSIQSGLPESAHCSPEQVNHALLVEVDGMSHNMCLYR